MQIKKLFKNSFFISRECKLFALLIIASVFLAYILFIIVAWQNHRNTYEKQYLSQALFTANSYETFLDNVFRQAEFIGHKISENKNNLDIKTCFMTGPFLIFLNLFIFYIL